MKFEIIFFNFKIKKKKYNFQPVGTHYKKYYGFHLLFD